MNKQKKYLQKVNQLKETILPFVIYRAPINNHIAYAKKGHWTQKEKLKYVVFLEYYRDKFTSVGKKKKFRRIFKLMSNFIKTRTHNQCRSHHQKMEKERFQVDSIIKNVVSKYPPRVYTELFERYHIQIKNLELSFHYQYKERSNRQEQIKTRPTSDLQSDLKLEMHKLNSKISFKQSQNFQYSFDIKKEEKYNNFSFQKSFYNKRPIRLTRESDSEEEEFQKQQTPLNYQFSIQNQLPIQKEQSLDFNRQNNYFKSKNFQFSQAQFNFAEYLHRIQISKLACLNRATFHYNQMHVEFNNLADCEREKLSTLQKQKHLKSQKPSKQSTLNYSFQQSYFHKQC